MILVDHQIAAAVENKDILIDPFDPSLINPNSLDISLSDMFLRYSGFMASPINPYDQRTINQGLIEVTGRITLKPYHFILGSTVETISLPADICAELCGKSSLSRLGLTNHQTGGFIDAGFSGQITLELCNLGSRPIDLFPGMPIGQLKFHQTEPAERPYGDRTSSKYQGQTGPVASRFYLNQKV